MWAGPSGVCVPVAESGTHEMKIIDGSELRVNDGDIALVRDG